MIDWFIIGDSQVRAFGYHPKAVPIFLGPASSYNSLNNTCSRRLEQALVDVVSYFGVGKQYLCCFSGDTRHFDHRNFTSESVQQPEFAASRYAVTLNNVRRLTGASLAVCEPFPKSNECSLHVAWARSYWETLIKQVDNSALRTASHSNIISPEGSLLPKYTFDGQHINADVARIVLEDLGVKFPDFAPFQYDNHGWRYCHELQHGKTKFKIWGDCRYRDLYLNNRQTHFFSHFHEKTALKLKKAELLLDEITRYRIKSAVIADQDEGLISKFLYERAPQIYLVLITSDSPIMEARKACVLTPISSKFHEHSSPELYVDLEVSREMPELRRQIIKEKMQLHNYVALCTHEVTEINFVQRSGGMVLAKIDLGPQYHSHQYFYLIGKARIEIATRLKGVFHQALDTLVRIARKVMKIG